MLKAVTIQNGAVTITPGTLGLAWHITGKQVAVDTVAVLAGSGEVLVRCDDFAHDEPVYFDLADLFDTPEEAEKAAHLKVSETFKKTG